MAGYIKLHRKITEWEWYTEVNTCKVFIHMLIKANHSENKWRGQTIKEGSFITSLESLSSETGLTVRQVRTALNNLNKSGDIQRKSSNKNTYIEIVNYERYQGNDTPNDKQDDKQTTSKMTNDRQSNDNQTTTNKNDKEYIKNDKEYKRNTYKGLIEAYTCNKTLVESLSGFVEMRVKMKGFTTNALELALKKLDKMAANDNAKIEIVNQSIENSWKSFYPIKQKTERTLPDWYQNDQQEDFKEIAADEMEEFMKVVEYL